MISIKNYVCLKWSNIYYKEQIYTSKIKNAQEAHEAIRPTNINLEHINLTDGEQKLYSLIWKRTVASQMAPTKINTTIMHISIEKLSDDYHFESKHEEIVFKGFLIVYNDNETKSENLLNDIQISSYIDMNKIVCKQEYEKPPTRYTEAAMIKFLEKNGIGRPSTYATMVDKVVQKRYAEQSDVKGFKKDCIIITLENNNMFLYIIIITFKVNTYRFRTIFHYFIKK
jgi:DNA topoisomerase-1